MTHDKEHGHGVLRAGLGEGRLRKVISTLGVMLSQRVRGNGGMPLASPASSSVFVGQVMTRGPRACGPDDSLYRAAQIMWETDCGIVPVVDDAGKVVAVVTDRDICMAAFTQGCALSQIPVRTASSRRVVAVREGDTLRKAEELMAGERVRRLPVSDGNDRLVGILSLSDITRHARLDSNGGELSAHPIAKTLAAIGTPPMRDQVQ